MTEKDFDIVVWGASGFTGRLVAAHLHRTHGQTLRWAIAGRDADKLKQVADGIGAGGVPVLTGDAHDRASLDRIAAQARVVITTVGPYTTHGADLVAACAEAGADYVDLCGEPPFMAQMIAAHHDTARRTGARIVHACGFDSVPFDLGVQFAEEAYEDRHGTQAADVLGVVCGAKGGFSGGTLASMVATMDAARDDPAKRRVLSNPYALATDPAVERPRQPDGLTPRHDDRMAGWLAPFVMAIINQRIVHRSNMLLGYPYGTDFAYLEMMAAKNRLAAYGMAGGLAAFQKGMGWGPSRRLLQRFLPEPGEGPDAAARENGYFRLAFVAGRGDDAVGVTVTGDRDPGYGGTSRMLGEAAMGLLTDRPEGEGGVLTPAAALGPVLRERLAHHAGVRFMET